MNISNMKFSTDVIDALFPAKGEEGQEVLPSDQATRLAADRLGVAWDEVRWVSPDVFNIRYGSSWVATAFSKDGRRVRFHSTDGDFRDEDAQVFEDLD